MSVKNNIRDDDDYIEYHRLNDSDEKKHKPSPKCWCEPELIYKKYSTEEERGCEIWIHRMHH